MKGLNPPCAPRCLNSCVPEADRALYERRALAVERESQISENEMQSKLDLARKRADLVDQEATTPGAKLKRKPPLTRSPSRLNRAES